MRVRTPVFQISTIHTENLIITSVSENRPEVTDTKMKDTVDHEKKRFELRNEQVALIQLNFVVYLRKTGDEI